MTMDVTAASAVSPDTATNSVPQTQATPPQQTLAQKIKVKVDGAEQEIGLDEITRDYQKYRSADKRFQEAAAIRKQFEPAIEKAKQGDFTDLEKLAGPEKTRQWAEKYLIEWMKFNELSPVEKEKLRLERELADEKQKSADRQAKEDADGLAAAKVGAMQEIDSEISQACQALGKKPTPRLIARIAETMVASMVDETKPRMNATDALRISKGEMDLDLKDYVANASAAELKALLPKKTLDALREDELDEAMSQAPMRARQKAKQNVQPMRPKKGITTDEWINNIERRISK